MCGEGYKKLEWEGKFGREDDINPAEQRNLKKIIMI